MAGDAVRGRRRHGALRARAAGPRADLRLPRRHHAHAARADRAAAGPRRFPGGGCSCGAHEPFDEAAAQALRRAARHPTRTAQQLLGQACRACCWLPGCTAGRPRTTWRSTIRCSWRILERVARFLRRRAGGDRRSRVDGCGAPALPAVARRRGARLRGAGGARQAGDRWVRRGRAPPSASWRAMTAAPEMVAGPGRFTTRLMEVTGGRVLGKEGAEGYYAVAMRAPGAARRRAQGRRRRRARPRRRGDRGAAPAGRAVGGGIRGAAGVLTSRDAQSTRAGGGRDRARRGAGGGPDRAGVGV